LAGSNWVKTESANCGKLWNDPAADEARVELGVFAGVGVEIAAGFGVGLAEY